MAASLTSVAGPLVLVLGTILGTGWRTLWPAFVAAFALILLLGFRPVARSVPDRPAEEQGPQGKLPRTYWRAWLLIFFGVGVEWCVGFWASSYLKGLPGASDGLAPWRGASCRAA
jgi:hypothetical protein